MTVYDLDLKILLICKPPKNAILSGKKTHPKIDLLQFFFDKKQSDAYWPHTSE